jgi:glutamate dehydrogenase
LAALLFSGVLHDPFGLSKDEIAKLADNRLTCSFFDRSLLGPGAFFVSVDDRDIELPDKTLVENGLLFRNNFQFSPYAKCDIFVPNGGRPEAINGKNVKSLFTDGQCLYKAVVEGANLFFSESARQTLEDAGIILFKDSSTNKGGVISSSCEVLAALALTDEQYAEHMQVTDPLNPPQFYSEFVSSGTNSTCRMFE